jgi:cell division septum initiation protein DivIVA
LTADLEAEKSMKDLIEKQKNRLKQKVDELETRLKTESDARDEMESEARKAKLDLRRMERELKAAVEDRDMLVRSRVHLSLSIRKAFFAIFITDKVSEQEKEVKEKRDEIRSLKRKIDELEFNQPSINSRTSSQRPGTNGTPQTSVIDRPTPTIFFFLLSNF